MPTYEYEIPETGEIIEIVHGVHEVKQKILSPKKKKLMACRRILSPNPIIFKGEGWTKKGNQK